MITAVSLFAGVGGFDLALERNGVKVVASVEIDKKAQEVLRRHFPNSTIFGDIMGVTGEQLIAAGFIPQSGIITGGFPCQDLSVAGKRAGLGGERSGLFWQICRLLDETRAQNFTNRATVHDCLHPKQETSSDKFSTSMTTNRLHSSVGQGMRRACSENFFAAALPLAWRP